MTTLTVRTAHHDLYSCNSPETLASGPTSMTLQPANSKDQVSSLVVYMKTMHLSPSTLSLRRQTRLARLEASRTRAREQLESCPETTPEELVVKSLERAISLLGDLARDTEERARHLHACLRDRKAVVEMDPSKYQDTQKERWMAERRAAILVEDAKATKNRLDALRQGQVLVRPLDRREANLIRMAECSCTRVPLRHNRRRPGFANASPSCSPRAHGQLLLPFILSFSRTSPLPSSPLRDDQSFTLSVPKPPPLRARNKEERQGKPESSGRSTSSSLTSTAHGAPSTPTSGAMPLSLGSPKMFKQSAPAGTATIYLPSQGRSRADILAEVDVSDVGIPAYARELLDEFDVDVDPESRAHLPAALQNRPSPGSGQRPYPFIPDPRAKPSMESAFTLISAGSSAEHISPTQTPRASKRTSALWPGRLVQKRTSALAVLDPVQPPSTTKGMRSRLSTLFNIGEESLREADPSPTGGDPSTPRATRQRGRYDSQRSTGTVRKLRNRFSIIGKR
ncbi:hypothetical protein PUNSTDRAFT_123029 [Punctularia strigosozonata HHB-11173 SS5]|uniref:Uncharacterized protein n=1 Tax=Punctularia strigosozonata (strain HHB-11173) TaxID=741275 RepID=R7S0M2_PUNST|nr:uncharacterized protein PUNSTDRAFT_123029 [Punctularia strigosozonata HHB-11173 SS5]EIN03945.1 hypothetical protein PUNSTDRAFT_123029 [Punctularia strigosozonata HHB-11173 SS5]